MLNPPVIERVAAKAFTVPTDAPEADGTFSWNETTLVIAQVEAGGIEGIGYTYSSEAVLPIIHGPLLGAIQQLDAFAIPKAWGAMVAAVRNLG
ncbi:hypothetical protein [Bradyrhizobium icense]|uniref:hypothetical protein n=1 Tax=Bradyrhizobium icense TaxID=1274631 RepID=UPI0012EAB0A9